MPNAVAIGLGVFLIALITLDALLFDWAYSIFWGRRLADLINWLAFWR